MKIQTIFLLGLLLLAQTACRHLTRNHEYWATANKRALEKPVPLAAYYWNYCDLKCLYLEHYYPSYDFVSISFSQTIKPNFAACFIRKTTSSGAASYAPWSTVA